MAGLQFAGYWPRTYWVKNYWMWDNQYWQKFHVPPAITGIDLIILSNGHYGKQLQDDYYLYI